MEHKIVQTLGTLPDIVEEGGLVTLVTSDVPFMMVALHDVNLKHRIREVIYDLVNKEGRDLYEITGVTIINKLVEDKDLELAKNRSEKVDIGAIHREIIDDMRMRGVTNVME